MSEIRELQREIHEISAAKGWHPEPTLDGSGFMIPDRVIAKLGLIHTELGEAEIEAAHGRFDLWCGSVQSKPEGYVVELADALIRALDLCEALGVTVDPIREAAIMGDDRLSIRLIVDAAIEAVRVGDLGRVRDTLSALWVDCHWLAHERGLDLDAAIRTKVDFNRTRPFRHGEKLA